MATVFGAFYVSLLSFILRLGHVGPAGPGRRAARVARRRSAAGSCCSCFAVWAYDTGAYLVGQDSSAGRSS